MPKVFVEPIGLTLTVDERDNLLDALVTPIDIPTDCAGRGTCGSASSVSAPASSRRRRSASSSGSPRSCAPRAGAWPAGVPRSARVSVEVRGTAGQRRILTTSKLTHGAAHPAVCTRFVQLEPPTLADKRSDLERLDEGLGGVEVPLHVLEELPATLRDGKWKARRPATAAGHRRAPGRARARVLRRRHRHRRVQGHRLSVRPARGTLIDQEAVENPQMRYGEDVISRIAHASSTTRRRRSPPPYGARQREPQALYGGPGRPPQPRLRHDGRGQYGDASPRARSLAGRSRPGAVRSRRRRAAHLRRASSAST